MSILKFKQKNKTTILLLLVILALENFCYLVPSNEYIIKGIIKYSDIGIILALVWITWVLLNIGKKNININNGILKYIVFYFALVVTSSIAANTHVHQPIMWGIRSLRYQVVCFIMYFFVLKAMKSKLLYRDDLIKIMYIVGIAEIVVYFLQYLLVGKVTFTYIDTDQVRNNTARLRFPFLLPLIIAIFSFNSLLNEKKHKVFHLLVFIFGSLVLIVICQHRAPSLIYVISLVIGFLLWKRGINIKILSGLLVGVLLFGFISNSALFQSTFDTLEGKNKNNASLNTMEIREEGQEYYFKKIKKAFIFGYGNPNLNSKYAMESSGANKYYYLADNGIIGFMYIYGIVGILWLIAFFVKLLKNAYMVYKKNINLTYIIYFTFEVGNLYIGMHWYYYYTLPFILIITLLSYDVMQIEGRLEKDEEY